MPRNSLVMLTAMGINISDLAIMASNWGVSSGATWAMGDLNGDGAVDIDDLAILAAQWVIPQPNYGCAYWLICNATSSSTVSLTWDADSGSGITYIVYRDGTEITTTASTGYNDSG